MATRLTVRIGMRVDALQSTAPIDLGLQDLRDNSSIVLKQPVVVRYAMERETLEFPETEMVWISQLGGVVVEIFFAAQRTALPIAATCALATMLESRVQNAGWRRFSREDLPAEEEVTTWLLSRAPHDRFQRTAMRWQAGATTLAMSLMELLTDPGRTPAKAADVRLLLNLEFKDFDLRMRQIALVHQKRRQVHGAPDAPLLLKAWLR